MHRENHIGDWGTPFGMLIEHLVDVGEQEAAHELSVGDLGWFYQQARASFDADEEFRERSRQRVVLLQSGDPETLRLWRLLVAESVRYFDDVYAKLGVLLTDDDIVGESFYNPMLPEVVADLRALGLLVEDDGALCVFPPGFTNREGEPLPLIVQKSDGGYGYAATDLASIRDRVDRIGATRILYVVGAPQAQHLQMCFAVAQMAGWLPEGTTAEHVSFGSVLGADRKMFKTRSGDSVKLVELLDEAVARASSAMAEREAGMSGSERDRVATGPRHRGREVRRPLQRPEPRLRVRLGPHAGVRGQHRPLPAVRARPHPFDLPPRRGGRARGDRAAHPDQSPRTGPRPAGSRLRGGGRRGGRVERPVQALFLPLTTWPRRSRPSTRTAQC